jgi:UPF0716 protein FxsA
MTRFVTLTAVLLPFLEIPGFVLVSSWLGIIPMLVLVIASVLVGILVLQRVGMDTLVNLRLAMARGEEPGHTLINAACFALGGFMLTIPGFISDFIAVALFLPWTRHYFLRRAARHFDVRVYNGGFGTGSPPGPGKTSAGVIEGEYSVVDSEEDPKTERPKLSDGASGS